MPKRRYSQIGGGATATIKRSRRYMRLRPRKVGGSRRLNQNTIYSFKRSCFVAAAFNVGATGSTCGVSVAVDGLAQVRAYTLNGAGANNTWTAAIPGASDFTGLFDQYKVKKFVIKIIPRINSMDQNASTTTFPSYPMIFSSTDLDDVTAETQQTLTQRNDCQIKLLDKVLSYTVYPRVSASSVYAATGNAVALLNNAWIDVTNNGAQYYGKKFAMQAYPGATADMHIEVHYQLKGSR